MLETFGPYVRNIPNPCLEEYLVRINLYGREDFKICTTRLDICKNHTPYPAKGTLTDGNCGTDEILFRALYFARDENVY